MSRAFPGSATSWAEANVPPGQRRLCPCAHLKVLEFFFFFFFELGPHYAAQAGPEPLGSSDLLVPGPTGVCQCAWLYLFLVGQCIQGSPFALLLVFSLGCFSSFFSQVSFSWT